MEERQAGEAIEYVLYGAAGELPDVGDVRAAVGGRLIDVSTTELPDDWGEDWRSFHKPLDIAPACGSARRGSRPARARSTSSSTPGQAFGTGSHATTRLTLELLADLAPHGRARRLGLRERRAGDRRREARLGAGARPATSSPSRSTPPVEGAASNGVSVEVTRCDVRQGGPPAPTVLANLVRPLLLEVAAGMTELPDRLIISGLEGDEPDEVVPAFERRGLRRDAPAPGRATGRRSSS